MLTLYYYYKKLLLYSSYLNEYKKVVSFLEEHLNIKSDSSEPQSETGQVLILCPSLYYIQANG